ncbi:hypothetical protein [Corynebacterium diphtheriae]|uniref:hypothetical protein n=1 Tax=Corynebacterium diphtheriae TaxID=1717 RepID=UPI001FD0F44C|nr:hypothetical protein [Corynebacterium diphtheriae]
MRKIELITCGVDQLEETKAQHPHAPVVDARVLPDPSEEVGDLFGTDPTVGEEIRRQGRKALSLAKKLFLNTFTIATTRSLFSTRAGGIDPSRWQRS